MRAFACALKGVRGVLKHVDLIASTCLSCALNCTCRELTRVLIPRRVLFGYSSCARGQHKWHVHSMHI